MAYQLSCGGIQLEEAEIMVQQIHNGQLRETLEFWAVSRMMENTVKVGQEGMYGENTSAIADREAPGKRLTGGSAPSAAAASSGAGGQGGGGASEPNDIITDGSQLQNGQLQANAKYQTGEFDYNYETDANGRITNWNTDDLQLTSRDSRLPHDANSPGKTTGDHAGHLAGDRFGGSADIDNIVSQSQNVNLSSYKRIENQWARAISEGKNVTTNVNIQYDGNSIRPTEFVVEYTIDGDYFSQSILN